VYKRDYRDVWGGGALVAIGGLAAVIAFQTLNMGTLTRMGPGMFPAAVGIILAALGVLILIPALFREGERIGRDKRSFVTIIGSMLVFAFLVRPFGLVPAIVGMTFLASRADSKLSWLATIVVAVCLSVGAIVVFRLGLGLPFSAFNWPW